MSRDNVRKLATRNAAVTSTATAKSLCFLSQDKRFGDLGFLELIDVHS